MSTTYDDCGHWQVGIALGPTKKQAFGHSAQVTLQMLSMRCCCSPHKDVDGLLGNKQFEPKVTTVELDVHTLVPMRLDTPPVKKLF